jgi:hypothetical protein
MTPRSLASLAHTLRAATDLDAAFVALADGLADTDRAAHLALLSLDAKSGLIRDRGIAVAGRVERERVDTAFDQFPKRLAQTISEGSLFADFADESPEFARLLGLPVGPEGVQLAILGIRVDGELSALLALVEPRQPFGTRAIERAAPQAALFELAYLRFAEREARHEAVQTLEDVTQRVHGEYVARLADLEHELRQVRSAEHQRADVVTIEREAAKAAEESRRNARRLAALEHQLTAAVGQLEQAHVELHRRSESLRQRTRTLFLIDRVLTVAGELDDPTRLATALLALVGDDMQALRCSLFLAVPGEPGALALAAGRGLAPHIVLGNRIRVGQGVAGKVAETREPLLVVDVADAAAEPLLGDEYLTTGSFISFPLVLHGALVGVVNLTNRAQRGLFVDEDVERVRMLGLVISLVASEARLNERLLGGLGVE